MAWKLVDIVNEVYMSNKGQGWPKTFRYQNKSLTKNHSAIYKSFCMFCAYAIEAQVSGERLQAHWSSGYTICQHDMT